MSEPGNDCPECGRRLRGRSCPCGWKATAEGSGAKPCEGCGDLTSLSTFHYDGDPGDAGRRYCASCWVPALKRRYEYDRRRNGDHCGEPGCTLTVAEHIAQGKRFMAKIATRTKPVPTAPVDTLTPEERADRAARELERFNAHNSPARGPAHGDGRA